MARNHIWVLAIALFPAAIGCLLSTTQVNVAPMVTINGPQTFVRGAPLSFTATVQDEGRVTYDWGVVVVDRTCPDDGSLPSGPRLNSGVDTTFTVTLPRGEGSFCTFVEVKDEQGAVGHATLSFQIADKPPTANITLVPMTNAAATEAIPLFSALRFSANASDPDGTTPTIGWQLARPSHASEVPPACPSLADDVCLTVDESGPYVLTVVVKDGDGMTAQNTMSFVVAPDQAPCIVDTDPPFAVQGRTGDPAAPLSFTVTSVDDDGDPLPAPADRPSMASFTWSWRTDAQAPFTRMADLDLPTFGFPADSFAAGQSLEVRVEAHDRRPQQPELLACHAEAPEPAQCLARAGCVQWVTWTVGIR